MPASGVLTLLCSVGGSQNMDGSYYDAIKRYITDFGELELANCSETMVLTQAPGPGPGLGCACAV